jgi:LysR family hydrogen peroxide-inducible transcriptional activator
MEFSLRQLEYARALEDHLSFREAADATGVSQPGLSTQLQALERALGVDLFERDRRGVWVTDPGRALLPRVRAVLRAAEELVEAAAAHRDPFVGRVRLGVIPTVAPFLLPRLMPLARGALQGVTWQLVEETTPRIVEAIERGDLDVGLLALEADLGSLARRPLLHEPFRFAIPAEHPLAGRKAVEAKHVVGEELLLLGDGHCLRDQAIAWCQRVGHEGAADWSASSLTTLVQMVASGQGATLLPASAEAGLEVDGLVLLPFRGPGPSRTIGLVWRPSSPRVELWGRVAELVVEAAPEGTRRA